jgi:hypothetical protein
MFIALFHLFLCSNRRAVSADFHTTISARSLSKSVCAAARKSSQLLVVVRNRKTFAALGLKNSASIPDERGCGWLAAERRSGSTARPLRITPC